MSLYDYVENLWVGIVTGAGEKAFCTGLNLRSTGQGGEGARPVPKETLVRGLKLYKPLIAAINGYALGGGLEIALACDIRIASENAYFQFPEVGRGLIPGLGGTQRLPRMITRARASEMILMGTPVNTDEAYRIGLVNKVVPLDQLLPTAKEWATKICDNGPLAVRRAKEAVIRGGNMALKDGLSLEKAFFEEMLQSEDYKEGLSALAEDRKPVYKGR